MKTIFLIMMVLLLVSFLTPLAAEPPGKPFSPAGTVGSDFMFPGPEDNFSKGIISSGGGVAGYLPGLSILSSAGNNYLTNKTVNQRSLLGTPLLIIEEPERAITTAFYIRT